MSPLLGKLEVYIEIKAPAAKFHEVMSRRPHHLSNISPGHVQTLDLHEGDWGKSGTVLNTNYVHDGVVETSKDIIESIDDENNSTTFKVIEGHLLEKYKNFHVFVQATPKGEGSLVHWTFTYEKLNEHVAEPHGIIQLAKGMTKDIEAHLIQEATTLKALIGKLETHIEIKAPAARFHKFCSRRPHHISNVSPGHIQSCEIHEGEWGKPGSVLYWNYVHDGVPETAKEIIESIDDENNSTTLRVIEGHILEKYKNFHIFVQAIPRGEGCLVHWNFTYEKLNENVAEPHGIIQLVKGMTKDIEAHLIQEATTLKALIGKLETHIEIKAPAAKFHKLFSRRPHHISNVSHGHIQSCEIHEGEWGKPGSVLYWKYVHDGVPETAKEIIESIDDENNSTTLRVIEGHLLEKYKNFHVFVQAIPKGEGCLVHWTFTYEKLNENVAEPHGIIQLVEGMTKDIEAHLIQEATTLKALIGKLETYIGIKALASKFHKLFSRRPHHISNVSPAHIQSCELHEGDWGKPGSVVYWNYVHDGVPETAKAVIEAIDDVKNSTTLKVIEGHLLEKYKSFHAVVEATPKVEGSLVHWTFTYEKVNENVAEPDEIVQLANGMTKDIEAHLVQEAY